jgi:hypothetical protein
MQTPITLRRPKDASKPHKPDHYGCCEYVRCIVWTGTLPVDLRRGRTDV